jgi:hypothetical protein
VVGVSVGGHSAERFLGAEPASAFSVAEPGRTDGQTDVFAFFLFFLDFFVGFFSPSLKLKKM